MRLWLRRGFARRHRYKRKTSSSFNKWLVFILVIIFTVYLFSFFDKKLRPTVTSIAEAKARFIATTAINEAVNEKLIENNITYSDLVSFQKNNEGQITALQANVVMMNKLKSALSITVSQKITEIDSAQISVPIGNLMNSEILSGWGPRIPVKLIPVGNVQMDFKNHFETAGINQTKHEIYLEVKGTVGLVLPTIQKSAEVVTTIPVAQTIIVGNVPQSYTNVEGTTSSAPDSTLNLIGD